MDPALLELARAYAHAAVDALIAEEFKQAEEEPQEEAVASDGNEH